MGFAARLALGAASLGPCTGTWLDRVSAPGTQFSLRFPRPARPWGQAAPGLSVDFREENRLSLRRPPRGQPPRAAQVPQIPVRPPSPAHGGHYDTAFTECRSLSLRVRFRRRSLDTQTEEGRGTSAGPPSFCPPARRGPGFPRPAGCGLAGKMPEATETHRRSYQAACKRHVPGSSPPTPPGLPGSPGPHSALHAQVRTPVSLSASVRVQEPLLPPDGQGLLSRPTIPLRHLTDRGTPRRPLTPAPPPAFTC